MRCRVLACSLLLLAYAPFFARVAVADTPVPSTPMPPPAPVPEPPPEPPVEPPEEDPAWPIPTERPEPYRYEADPKAAQETEQDKPAAPRQVEIVRATMRGEMGHRAVRDVRRLGPGARPEFDRQGQTWAFDRPSDLGYRAIYIGDATGERCLSCDIQELRKSHVMAPTWHPSGEFLVVLVQDAAARLDLDERRLASPARALHSELWALTRDGRQAWRLTKSGEEGRAVFDAVFAHEGTRLAWSERVASAPEPWGTWVVRVADWQNKRGVPMLSKVQTYEPSPWKRFLAVDGFRADDRGLLLSAEDDQKGVAVGTYDFAGRRFQGLTDPQGSQWPSELLRELPGTERLLEASARGLAASTPGGLRPRDLWLLTPSGRGRERLTYFNEPGSRYALGHAQIVDVAVDSEGKRILLQVLASAIDAEGKAGPIREGLYLLELDPKAIFGQPGERR
jgi:hypothetical protein